MIIQRRRDEVLLIRQEDHARLAADIMACWHPGGLGTHPRREEILTATRDHDIGWQEEDDRMHVGAGGEPLDFITVPTGVKQAIWPRALERLACRSAYVAALVAQHALTIYAQLASDPGWQGFCAAITRARDEHLSAAFPGAASAAAADYPFVRTGDLLSLIFCNGWREPQDGGSWRAILEGTTLHVTPDPFDGRSVPLTVPARPLPARAYRSREDLRRAYADASPMLLEGEAIGS